eukprot:3331172-Prorocentrum_lima.AAC.1
MQAHCKHSNTRIHGQGTYPAKGLYTMLQMKRVLGHKPIAMILLGKVWVNLAWAAGRAYLWLWDE